MVDKTEVISTVQEDLENEVQRLRERVKKLDRELESVKGSEDINDRLMRELSELKEHQATRPQSGSTEQLRQERNELQEENRRLVQMLKDSKKWDSHLLQRDNERLQKMIKELETNGSVGGSSASAGKLKYFEKLTRQLEKERSELMVRCTMAEE